MSELLPETNADGEAVVPMTDEQKYVFDLKGWMLLPALLDEDEIEPIREHQYRVSEEPDSLPPEQRHHYGGPAERLLDHPVLVGILNEIISHQPMASADCYGFRYDGSFCTIRSAGHDNFSPHGGGGLHNFCGNSHLYQHQPGKIHAGLTRVVWELNPVRYEGGGTLLLSGSHKAAFPRPEAVSGRDSPLFETYGCPAGSVMIFTEALCHAGSTWTDEMKDRIALFTCYNTVGAKWHRGGPPKAVVDAMPPMRQTLFRSVWTGAGEGQSSNKFYDDSNRAV